MFAIGNIIFDEDNHGHSISNVKARIVVNGKPTNFLISNYEQYKDNIKHLISNGIYGGVTCGLFEFNPDDQFADYIHAQDIVSIVTNISWLPLNDMIMYAQQ